MPNRPLNEQEQPAPLTEPRETHLEPLGEVVVEYHPAPPKGPPNKSIHPRRPLPLVPDRRPDADEDQSSKSE